MTRRITKTLQNRIYLIICLCWISISQSSCLINYYSPASTVSFTGTTSYCQGAAATPNTLTYGQCSLGGGIIDAGVPYTAQWYYNTTGGTVIGSSTPLGAPISNTSPAGGGGTEYYTPLTTTPGTFYYFCYFTWTTTGSCAMSYTSNTQTITISPPPAALTGTATVCIGGTTTLSTTSTGGAWSSSAPTTATVSSAGVVTGINAGTVTISYGSGSCFATRTVTVNPPPAAITPATAVVICQGSTSSFASTTGGGTWSTSDAAVATVSGTGLVTATGGGTATITYTAPTGCYTTKNLTVNPTPLAIAGPNQVCPLGTITLTDPSPGGVWSSSDVTKATVNPSSGVVTGVGTGTVTISYTGCGSATMVVSVHPSPATITGPSDVCMSGGTIVLSDATAGGTWSSGAPATASATTTTSTTGTITGHVVGTADITYTSVLGCVTSTTVNVIPPPDVIVGNTPVCVGQFMTLTNSVPGGSWNSAAAGIASVTPTGGLVTGVAAGTTLISYTNMCGTSTVLATINPIPAAIIGRDTVCVGSETVLADATLGGTWSTSSPTVATVMLTSGVVSAVSIGTAYITYTMPGGCYNTATVNVLAAPSAIGGPSVVCAGSNITLTNATSGGTWSSSHPSVATVGTSGVVTGVSADTAVIVYTTPSRCAVETTITVNPLPAPIESGSRYCPDIKDTLFDATPGGTWSSATPSIATIDPVSGIMTSISGGNAIIRYTLPTGCSVSRTISINPLPAPSITYIAAANTFYTDTGYNSYQWYNSIEGLIPGATTYRTAALYYGTYWVVVTDDNACLAESTHYPYNSSSSVGNTNKIACRIYPNPANDLLYIEAPVSVRAIVTSVDGKALIDKENAKELNVSSLADGLYMVLLYDANGQQVSAHKFIKQH